MSKTRTLNKTITTALILFLTLSMLSVINIVPKVYATTIISREPASGPVGTNVTITGTIDTLGGPYKIYFDSDGSGVCEADEEVTSGTADVYNVSDWFLVPHSVSGVRMIILHDAFAKTNGTAAFTVTTTWYIDAVQDYGQEEITRIQIITNVTGGGNTTTYPVNITVTKPDSTIYSTVVNVLTNATGYGYNDTVYSSTDITQEYIGNVSDLSLPYLHNFSCIPAVDGSESFNATFTYTPYYNETGFVGINITGAGSAEHTHVNYTCMNFTTWYTGTYTVGFNVSSETDTFDIILTNATTYLRGDVVNLRSTGWNYTTPQHLNFTITDPDGIVANTTVIDVNATAPRRTANYTWTIPSAATLGTYTVTVTNATAGLNKTALGYPDTSTFEVTGVGVLQFTNKTYPDSSYVRTQTASWKFNVTYPDGGNFTSANMSSNPVYVYCNGSQTASATVTNYDGGYWNATWAIPKDQTPGTGYCFNISKDSWTDKLENSGPDAAWTSSNFTILLANLTVTWYNSTLANWNASATPKSWQNCTLWQNCTFRITYPDDSVLTESLTSVLNVTVWNSTHTVANLTKAAGNVTYDSVTGNWTVKWHIPCDIYNATDESRYKFCLLANYTEDNYGNKGPMTASKNSTEFKVTSAVITVLSISTTQSSYARGTYIYVRFTATYPDGSSVTTGNATITLTRPDETSEPVYATYSADIGKFQASKYLDTTARLGTWTATLAVNGLNDTKSETPRWYPGNLGPTTAVNTTFTVTESSLLVQINDTVTDLENKLDNIDYGLEAIKNAVDAIEAKLDEGGTFYTFVNTWFTTISNKLGTFTGTDTVASVLYNIKAKLDDTTFGLNAIKTAVDQLQTSLNTLGNLVTAIKAKTDTIDWTDITTIKDKIILAPSEAKFDFGTETSLWENEFIQVTPSTEYSSDLGYGWTNTTDLYSRDRGEPDYARRDLVFSSENRTFKVDLSNGNYTVIVTLGDQSYRHDNMSIYAEGDLKATVSTDGGIFAQKVFIVSVTDGNLELTLVAGGVTPYWVINTLIIQRSWSK